MVDARLDWLLRTQDDMVAWWQLAALGWSEHRILHHVSSRGWVRVHVGVFAAKRAPLTRRQRWFAAVLTEPGTVLANASAAAAWGFRTTSMPFETVVRPGSGGPRTIDGVVVSRSRTHAGETVWHRGLPITGVERTLIDLSPGLSERQRGKATREAIRLGLTTAPLLLEALDRHRGRRGTAPLRILGEKYLALPLERTRSDAEGLALERLFDAGLPIPSVNESVGRYEADLIDHDRRLIVELDGPSFHLFPDEDELRNEEWRRQGYRVVRLSTDSVYERP